MESVPSSRGPATPDTVVVADDDAAIRGLVRRWLEAAGFRVVEAGDGSAALAAVKSAGARLAVVVLDVMMPSLDGFGVLEALRADGEGASVPVVLLTAHANDEADLLRGIAGGASDHLAKPFSGPVLVARVKQLAQTRAAALTSAWRLARAERAATRDPLTGLANRRQFESDLEAELAFVKRHGSGSALVLIDLDHFKTVNDVFGHEAGDRVLCHFAATTSATLRAEDRAYRIGGEEFALIVRGTDPTGAERVAARLRDALGSAPLELGKDRTRYFVRFSAGIAPLDGARGAVDVLRAADEALYVAKRQGRNRAARAG